MAVAWPYLDSGLDANFFLALWLKFNNLKEVIKFQLSLPTLTFVAGSLIISRTEIKGKKKTINFLMAAVCCLYFQV